MSQTIHIFSNADSSKRPFFEACVNSILKNEHNICLWVDKNEISAETLSKLCDYADIMNCTTNKYVNVCLIDSLDCYEPILQAKQTWSTSKSGSLAPYVDIIRLEILSKYGGWWIDDDAVLLKPIDTGLTNHTDQMLYAFADYSLHPQNTMNAAYICNYAMGSLSNTPNIAAKKLLDICYDVKDKKQPSERRYHEFGPYLLQSNYGNVPISMIEPHKFPSIAIFPRLYKQKMDETSILDILQLRETVGLHLSCITTSMIAKHSILWYIIEKGSSFNDLMRHYHRQFIDFTQWCTAYNKHRESHGIDAELDLHILQTQYKI